MEHVVESERERDAVLGGLVAILADQTGIVAAYLFGSYGRGMARPDSDVDVAVLFEAPPSSADRLAIRARLAAEVAPRRLDLVVLDEAPPVLVHRVLRDGIVLVGAEDVRRTRHAARMMDRYLGMAPIERWICGWAPWTRCAGSAGAPRQLNCTVGGRHPHAGQVRRASPSARCRRCRQGADA